MADADWYVGLDGKTLDQAINSMKNFHAAYLRDMGSLEAAEQIFSKFDPNTMSIDELKQKVLDATKVNINHMGKLPVLCKDGKVRNYNPESWAETIARTRSRGVQEEGLHNEMASAGFDLVIVSVGGSGDDCTKWEGKILSISGRTPGLPTTREAQRTGEVFHPRCVHSTSPVIITQDEAGPELWGRDDLPPVARQQLKKLIKGELSAAVSMMAPTGESVIGGAPRPTFKSGSIMEHVYLQIEKGVTPDELAKSLTEKFGIPASKAKMRASVVISNIRKKTGLDIRKVDGKWVIARGEEGKVVEKVVETTAAKKAVEKVEKKVEKKIVEKSSDKISQAVTVAKEAAEDEIEKFIDVGKAVIEEAEQRAREKALAEGVNLTKTRVRNELVDILREKRSFGGFPEERFQFHMESRDIKILKKKLEKALQYYPTDWIEEYTKDHFCDVYMDAQRSYFYGGRKDSSGEIHLDKRHSQINVITHELGHLFESQFGYYHSHYYNGKDPQKILKNWRKKRIGDEALKPIGGGYGADEKGWRDKFADRYLGKYYPDGSTEIFSMGMEYFTGRSTSLAPWGKDPEWDSLIIGVLLSV